MKTEFEKWFDSKYKSSNDNENRLDGAIRYLTVKSGWNAAIDKCLDIIRQDNNIPEILQKLNDLKNE